MKWILILLMWQFAGVPIDEQDRTTVRVSGRITQTSSYCGGAAPDEELLERLRSPVPMSLKLYVRSGDKNIMGAPLLDSCVTDADGYFEFHLPKGRYVIISEMQIDHSYKNQAAAGGGMYVHADEQCLQRWFENGLFAIEVSDTAISGLEHIFHEACFVPSFIPCFSYFGPMPP